MKTHEVCRNCRFWHLGAESVTHGTCHRRSPLVGEKDYRLWPLIEHDNFCGEFEMKEMTKKDVGVCWDCVHADFGEGSCRGSGCPLGASDCGGHVRRREETPAKIVRCQDCEFASELTNAPNGLSHGQCRWASMAAEVICEEFKPASTSIPGIRSMLRSSKEEGE